MVPLPGRGVMNGDLEAWLESHHFKCATTLKPQSLELKVCKCAGNMIA